MKNYLLQYLHSDNYLHRSYTICIRTLIGLLCSSSSLSCSASLSRSLRWEPHFSTLVSSIAFQNIPKFEMLIIIIIIRHHLHVHFSMQASVEWLLSTALRWKTNDLNFHLQELSQMSDPSLVWTWRLNFSYVCVSSVDQAVSDGKLPSWKGMKIVC